MNRNLKISNLVLILLGLKVLYYTSTISYYSIIDQILLVCGCALGAVYIIVYYRMSLKTCFIIGIVSTILLISSVISKNASLMISWLTIIIIKDKPINEFIKLSFFMKVLFIITHLLYSLLIFFINPNSLLIQYSDGIRLSFFTSHPNVFSSIVMWTVMEWLWLKFDKIKFKDIITFIIITILTYACTKTDATIFICLIFIALFVMYKCGYCNILCKISKWIMPFLMMITFGMVNLFNTTSINMLKIISFLDKVLSRRISASAYAKSIYNYTMFGQVMDLSSIGWSDTYQLSGIILDNLYISVAFRIGIIILILISISFYKLSNLNKGQLSIFIIMFCVYGLIETQGLIIYYCFTLSFIKYLLNNKMIDEILK